MGFRFCDKILSVTFLSSFRCKLDRLFVRIRLKRSHAKVLLVEAKVLKVREVKEACFLFAVKIC